ncbi:MAG: SDR family NAD(P)-dependent oxidoreductase [Verrucomicrobium sp.]|nr:SDR family NAD(P)-dependent oxidoreductase [Verrucomicrobium sp.]
MKMKGNTILITGGTSGIGLELARALSRENTVLITGRDAARLRSATGKLPGVRGIQSDVSDPAAIAALYRQVAQEYPTLNVLINNAGQMRAINFHQGGEDLAELTREIDTNLAGPIRMTRQFLPLLKKQPEAAIMNVSSLLAFVPMAIAPVYCATKAAVHSFTLSLRVQLKGSRVRVFELAPPPTDTAMLTDAFGAEGAKDIPKTTVPALVKAAVDGLRNDTFEIRPGMSNALNFLGRLAPVTALKKLNKPTEAVFAGAA